MPSPPPANAVELRNVSVRADAGREILHQVTLEVHRGETLVLLGRSGSGKTTTLKLINQLVLPSAGEVWVEGRRATEWNAIALRRRIGYVIQEVGLFPHFTVERNVGLVPALEGWPPERIRDRVGELLRLAGLDPDFASRFPHQLSGGQRQRVGVARALAADPPLLLMDEPFGALDPITRAELQQEFLDLQRRLGKSVVFVTHDVHEALRLATRIGLFDSGRLAGIYAPDEFRHTKDALAEKFLSAVGGVA
ncbi:MAG TPA: ATP-binding cassette domain-containing protein [Terriglobia bacterium]|nr:ATP-binding cassette domain-containing protein [Terriglobia bacterium]